VRRCRYREKAYLLANATAKLNGIRSMTKAPCYLRGPSAQCYYKKPHASLKVPPGSLLSLPKVSSPPPLAIQARAKYRPHQVEPTEIQTLLTVKLKDRETRPPPHPT
jgi:hypothetical protein